MLELKESQKKTGAQLLGLKEYHRQTEALLQKTIKEFRATQKSWGDLGLVQGEVAEDLFYRSDRCCRSTGTARYWPESEPLW